MARPVELPPNPSKRLSLENLHEIKGIMPSDVAYLRGLKETQIDGYNKVLTILAIVEHHGFTRGLRRGIDEANKQAAKQKLSVDDSGQ